MSDKPQLTLSASESGIKVTQETNYPWASEIIVTVAPVTPRSLPCSLEFLLGRSRRRYRGMANRHQALRSRVSISGLFANGTRGEKIRLTLDIATRLIVADSRVREKLRRVAVERGIDSNFDVSLPVGADSNPEFSLRLLPDKLGGVLTLRHRGIIAAKALASEPLDQTFESAIQRTGREVELTFIPHCVWAHRWPTEVEVWILYALE